mmetsp:Transcript_118162/g.294735  ORF Transcript_118162/g.294735 Transcript_118162/m.294735 type:complete len:286 (-) Transcript_118162:525-1382(-)
MIFSNNSFKKRSCSEPPLPSDNFCFNSLIRLFSSSIWFSSAWRPCSIFSLFASLTRLKSSYFCCSSSRACSMSCEFWIKNKLEPSKEVKTSSNCASSWKKSGISSPLETSSYSPSKCSRFGYLFRMRRRRASNSFSRSRSASSASRRGLRRVRAACSAAFSSLAFSSAAISSCILASDLSICLSTQSFFRCNFLSLLSCCLASFHSCGVSLTKKSLYFKHSSFRSRCRAISLCSAASCVRICLICWIFSCFFLVVSSADFMALCAFWSFCCKKASNRVTSSSNNC